MTLPSPSRDSEKIEAVIAEIDTLIERIHREFPAHDPAAIHICGRLAADRNILEQIKIAKERSAKTK